MFINVDDIEAVQALQRGEFALPSVNQPMNVALADTRRLRTSIGAMRTTLTHNGFAGIADLIPGVGDGLLSQHMAALEAHILIQMQHYIHNQHDQNAANRQSIFHMVQLWGGKTGRNIYVRDGGFAENYSDAAYQGFVGAATAMDNLPPDDRTTVLSETERPINQWAIAFATKHAQFWAIAAGAEPLPIFDSIMARGALGIGHPNWRLYDLYRAQMLGHAAMVAAQLEPLLLGPFVGRAIVHVLERYVFNVFSTDAGRQWIKARGGSKDDERVPPGG